jgi:hypothetical protein
MFDRSRGGSHSRRGRVWLSFLIGQEMNIRKSLCKAFDCARYCPKTCEEEIARLKEEYEGQISKLKGQVNDYRMQIDDLQKKIDECKSLVSNLEAQVEDWKKKYEEEKARPKRPDYCRPDECPFKPNDPDDDPPKLRVEGNRIFYGNDPIKLCSVSRWEALWREKGLYYDWRPYSLAWYEEELAKYGINYVRHGAVKDFDFVYQHCKRMKEKGIIVELTIFRSLGEGRLIDLIPENIQALVGLGNVFFDCHNEFMDSREDVFEAKRIAEIISENGGIVSGGAWGASTYGEENAALFQQVCPYHKISTVHRQWNKAEIEKSL